MSVSLSYEMLEELVRAPLMTDLYVRPLTQFEIRWVRREIREYTFDDNLTWYGLFSSDKVPQFPLFINHDLEALQAGLRDDLAR